MIREVRKSVNVGLCWLWGGEWVAGERLDGFRDKMRSLEFRVF